MAVSVNKLLSSVTTAVPTYGNTITLPEAADGFSIQYNEAGTGAITATVVTYVSNDATNWITLATTSLSGTTSTSDGFSFTGKWQYIRSGVTAISGTSATVNGFLFFGSSK